MKASYLIAGWLILHPAVSRAESLGDRIVSFCKENKDKAVGDGDCYDLAKFALKNAGARGNFKNPDFPAKGDYVWGQLVVLVEGGETESKKTGGKLRDVKPGDVIQMRDTHWEGPRANGKGKYTLNFKHHTAVIASVEDDGKLLKIYHQNMGGKKFVVEGSLKPDHLKTGWIRIYRPLPAAK